MRLRAKCSLLISASAVALAGAGGTAGAQTPISGAGPAVAVEEVLVTGSRTITDGNKSPTPLTVLSINQLQQANPTGLAAALASMPAMLGTAGADGSAPNYAPVLNLRGLGGGRNLVLFDGQRLAPTSGNGGLIGGVNAALIPTVLLKRVDIVTGGASAVYGSDAVSGVINYIMENSFNGLKFEAQASQSTYGDDRAYRIGIGAGTELLGGRGHFEASYERLRDDGIPDRSARGFSRNGYSIQGVGNIASNPGTAANPFGLISNSRMGNTSLNGVINSGVLSGLQFTPGGTLTPFVHGALTGTPDAEIGGDGGYYTTINTIGSQRQDVGFARFDFDLNSNIKFYTEIVSSLGLTINQQQNFELSGVSAAYNNPYLRTVQAPYQAQIAAALAANPAGSFKFSRIYTGDQVHAPMFENEVKQNLIFAGLDGKLGKYTWHIGAEAADNGTKVTDRYNISNARMLAAINAVSGANGQTVCAASLTNPSVYGGCVPLNIFGQVDPAALAYIQQFTQYNQQHKMQDVSASLAGAPFENWAGPVNMAVSAEWRRQTYGVSTNAQTTDPVNCTGIQFSCTSRTRPYFATASAFMPETPVTVSEVAFEANVPLLNNKPLAKYLSLDGAVRYTNYSSSGSVATWKGGLVWTPNDDWNLRISRSHDIRAPSPQQLYAPPACAPLTFSDLISGTRGITQFCLQGNPDLKPEVADSWTAGVVWKPEFFSGFSTSLDWYHISIAGAQNILSPATAAANLACFNSGGTSPICALYIRPTPTSFPTQTINKTLNSSGIVVDGVDWEVDYATRLAGRRFTARLLANYQPTLTINTISGIFKSAGSVNPEITGVPPIADLKSVLQLDYEVIDNLTVGLQARYRNAMKEDASSQFVYSTGKVPSVTYADLNVSYRLKPAGGDMILFLNIRNLFNKQPPPADGGYVQGDDLLGRYYTLGIRHTF